MAYCTACGRGAAPDDRFCTKCGRSLHSSEAARDLYLVRENSIVLSKEPDQLRERTAGRMGLVQGEHHRDAQAATNHLQNAVYVVYKQWFSDDNGSIIGWTGKVVVFDLGVYRQRRQGHVKKYRSSEPMSSEALERARLLALATGDGKRIRVFPDGQLQVASGTNPNDYLYFC